MLWTFLALALTVLMGGIIAYNGDVIGRRFGKKRVTMFGLRPRYTAVLITSVTGILISGITTGVLFLLVPSVRDVILRGEQAIADRKGLLTDKASLTEQASILTSQVASFKQQVVQEKREYAALTKKNEVLDKQVSAKEDQLRAAQGRLADTQKRLAAAESRIIASEAKLADLTKRNSHLAARNTTLADINASLAGQISQLTQKREELTKQTAELARRNGEYETENLALARRNEDLTRQNNDLDKRLATLDHQAKALQRDAEVHRSFIFTQKAESDRLTKENAALTSENKSLKGLIPGYASLREAYQATRSRRVAVHKDEDLARIVIPARTTKSAAKTYIQTLLREASEAAKERGASPGESVRAVQVVDRHFLEATADGQLQTVEVTGEDRIEAVAEKVAMQPVPCVLLAIAVTNSVEQEPAGIDLQPLPNRRVFNKGEMVYGRYVNGTQGATAIFEDVVLFLKETGRTALQRGVIPRMDPLTGEPEVGAMNYAGILDIVEKVRGVGGRARVRAVAQDEIHSADPLKLRFEVMH